MVTWSSSYAATTGRLGGRSTVRASSIYRNVQQDRNSQTEMNLIHQVVTPASQRATLFDRSCPHNFFFLQNIGKRHGHTSHVVPQQRTHVPAAFVPWISSPLGTPMHAVRSVQRPPVSTYGTQTSLELTLSSVVRSCATLDPIDRSDDCHATAAMATTGSSAPILLLDPFNFSDPPARARVPMLLLLRPMSAVISPVFLIE